jgi:hypothetical protein
LYGNIPNAKMTETAVFIYKDTSVLETIFGRTIENKRKKLKTIYFL